MLVKEDGAEKTKQLFVGAVVLVVAGWLLWQWWFGNGLFEGKALVKGQYGSGATEMVQLVVFLVMQVGALALGLFRSGTEFLKWLGGFFFGSKEEPVGNQRVTIDILQSQKELVSNKVNTPVKQVKVDSVGPLFRVDNSGVLFRDELLEKKLSGPQTPDELAADAVDALMSGDELRLNKRFNQLHGKDSLEVEVKKDEPKQA